MERALECAADIVGVGPGNLGVERFQAPKLQPNIRADLQIQVRRRPESVRGKIENADGNAAGTALTETCAHFNMGTLRLASLGARGGSQMAGYLDWVAVVQHGLRAFRRALPPGLLIPPRS